jgi:hypothetical protein
VNAPLVRADTLAAFVLIYSVPVIVPYHRGLGHVLDGLRELRHAS